MTDKVVPESSFPRDAEVMSHWFSPFSFQTRQKEATLLAGLIL